MDNFLEHLVARSWNRAAVVQPRPVSLFEPTLGWSQMAAPPITSWDITEETTAEDRAIVTETRETSPPPALKPQPSPPPRLDAEPMAEPQKPGVVPVAAAQPVHPILAGPPPTPTPANPAEGIEQVIEQERPVPSQPAAPPLPLHSPLTLAVVPPSAPPIAWASETNQPAKQVETHSERVLESLVERTVFIDKPDKVVVKTVSLPPPTAQSGLPPQQVELFVPSPAAPTAVFPPAAIEPTPTEPLKTLVHPPIRPFMPQQPADPPPDPTPTINVTIGRIEVRAAPPTPPPTRKERTQPAAMGLEEYLRQRNGGQR